MKINAREFEDFFDLQEAKQQSILISGANNSDEALSKRWSGWKGLENFRNRKQTDWFCGK